MKSWRGVGGCVCVCVCACVRACLRKWCVCERERKRELVCVCVCVRENESERVETTRREVRVSSSDLSHATTTHQPDGASKKSTSITPNAKVLTKTRELTFEFRLYKNYTNMTIVDLIK